MGNYVLSLRAPKGRVPSAEEEAGWLRWFEKIGGQIVSAALPAQFVEPGVIDAEMVCHLVDDGFADLVGDFILGLADGADRLAVDRDLVWEHPGVLSGPAGQRDALVESEQPEGSRAVLHDYRDIAHQPPEFRGQPVKRCGNHLLEALGLNLDHQSILHELAVSLCAAPCSGPSGGG